MSPDPTSFGAWLQSETGRAAVAGALGGVVRWVTLQSRPHDGAASLIVGSISAVYLGPIALTIVDGTVGKIITGQDLSGLASFLVGIGGMALTGLVIDVFNRRRLDLANGGNDEPHP